MSQNAAELCLLLIDDLFGDVAVRVLEILLQRGRLTHPSLLRHAGLAPRQLKHTLVVLIHHELVKYYQPEVGAATYYEADWTAAYALVRSGKLVASVTQTFGSLAGSIVSHVIANGHTQVSDLIDSMDVTADAQDEPLTKSAQANGLSNGKRKLAEVGSSNSKDSMHKAIYDLLIAGYLTVLHESHLRPQADNVNEAIAECKRRMQLFGVLKKTEQAEVDRAVRALLLVWISNKDGIKTQNSVNNMKRGFEGADMSDYVHDKKRKGNGGCAANDTVHLNLNLVLRINHEKLAVITRNQRLVRLAEQQISKPCSSLYAAFLNSIQRDMIASTVNIGLINEHEEEEDEGGPGMTTKQIADLTQTTLSLVGSIGTPASMHPSLELDDHPKKRRRKQVFDGGDIDEYGNISGIIQDHDLEDDEMDYTDHAPKKMRKPVPPGQTHESLVEKNLILLATHEHPFLTQHEGSASSPTRWTISFRPLAAALRLAEIHTVIGHKHTRASLRLVRLLAEKGALDEKTITSVSLLPPKDLRYSLTAMHEAGLLELQEIPRDTNRQPARTIFLWVFDAERARRQILEDAYKAMARAMQRARAERADATVRAVVGKAERSDVRGREEEFMSGAEMGILRAWREREERLMGSVARLDDLVAVLRDY